MGEKARALPAMVKTRICQDILGILEDSLSKKGKQVDKLGLGSELKKTLIGLVGRLHEGKHV